MGEQRRYVVRIQQLDALTWMWVVQGKGVRYLDYTDGWAWTKKRAARKAERAIARFQRARAMRAAADEYEVTVDG
jgi:hypothetical protein